MVLSGIAKVKCFLEVIFLDKSGHAVIAHPLYLLSSSKLYTSSSVYIKDSNALSMAARPGKLISPRVTGASFFVFFVVYCCFGVGDFIDIRFKPDDTLLLDVVVLDDFVDLVDLVDADDKAEVDAVEDGNDASALLLIALFFTRVE